jgi:hypothetical protein
VWCLVTDKHLPDRIFGAPIDQEFMDGAGDNGVLLVAMGTIATLSAPSTSQNPAFPSEVHHPVEPRGARGLTPVRNHP